MKVPDKFPPGCKFLASFSGDDFVVFPDGKVFVLDDSGESLNRDRRHAKRRGADVRSQLLEQRQVKRGIHGAESGVVITNPFARPLRSKPVPAPGFITTLTMSSREIAASC